jgi:hypothetical protein
MRIRTLATLASILPLMSVTAAFASAPGPEIDPGTATGGFALVVASVLLIRERYRGR